jgi:hypothetical protein
VGPLLLQHAHQVLSRSRIRRRLLSPPIQAKSMAGVGGRGFRRGKGIRRVQLEFEAGVQRPQETGINRSGRARIVHQHVESRPTRLEGYGGKGRVRRRTGTVLPQHTPIDGACEAQLIHEHLVARESLLFSFYGLCPTNTVASLVKTRASPTGWKYGQSISLVPGNFGPTYLLIFSKPCQ